jgi:ATP-binding cassette subfamily F protein 3
MRLLHLDSLSVIFPGRTLIENVVWSIFRGERHGLVGANGTGKTTLLRLIVGEAEPSSGVIARTRGLTVGYLPQEGVAQKDRGLFEEAWSGLPDLPQLEREIEQLRQMVAADSSDADALERLGALQHRWEDLEGYHAEAKVARVLGGLGFKERDFRRPASEFSGGWQMRIALAKLLLYDPDLLLLDEPTNHLDLPALVWLEGYLGQFRGALIVVSHDRDFLDRIVERIAALDRGKLRLYRGNYTEFERQRAVREEQREAEEARAETERKRIESFVERFRYKATKARQVQSRIKMLEKLQTADTPPPPSSRRVHFCFPPAPPSGKIVLELKGLTKNYGPVQVFSDLDLVLSRGEKIALVGVNGAGKSTLCRLLVGVEAPSSGEVLRGHNVTVDYFAQEADFHLDPKLTVLEQLEAEAGSAPQSGLRSLLGAFLFSGDDVFKRISVLSGGEKSRLALAKMLLRPSNFLILDEPTNHLDMASQEVLLEALRTYEGTLLVVSHDRYFLDRLVNRVLELEDGSMKDWAGNLSEYIERKSLDVASSAEQMTRARVPAEAPHETGFKSRERKRTEAEIRNRLSRALRAARDKVENLQGRIDQAEARRQEIERMLSGEEIYKDVEKYRQLLSEFDALRATLPRLLEEWEAAALRLQELERDRDAELSGSNA